MSPWQRLLGKLYIITLGTLTTLSWKTWEPWKPLQCNLGNLENRFNATLGTLATCTMEPWVNLEGILREPWKNLEGTLREPWQSNCGNTWEPWKPLQCNLGNLENLYNATLGTLATCTMEPWVNLGGTLGEPLESNLGNLEGLMKRCSGKAKDAKSAKKRCKRPFLAHVAMPSWRLMTSWSLQRALKGSAVDPIWSWKSIGWWMAHVQARPKSTNGMTWVKFTDGIFTI